MLILTRKVGETLHIGEDITVTILGIKGGQVRIGTVAPPDVEVHRSEIYDRIHEDGHHQQGNAPRPRTGNSKGKRDWR